MTVHAYKVLVPFLVYKEYRLVSNKELTIAEAEKAVGDRLRGYIVFNTEVRYINDCPTGISPIPHWDGEWQVTAADMGLRLAPESLKENIMDEVKKYQDETNSTYDHPFALAEFLANQKGYTLKESNVGNPIPRLMKLIV